MQAGRTQPAREHVRQTLRSATALAHRELDRHPLLKRLMDSPLTHDQYAQSLAAIYRSHAGLERRVHESRHHLASGFTLDARLEFLQADLAELGVGIPSAPETARLPLEARAAWWGRVYVLEGSRQGGAVIAGRLRSSLGETVPCRFFGAAPLPREHEALLAMRGRDLEGHEELEQAVASAREAFADYKAGLDAFDRARATCQ